MDYSIFDSAFYKLFEKSAVINFNQPDNIDYPETSIKGGFDRLKNLISQLDEHGSSLLGEKIAQVLFGAHNLNYYDRSYPFVDIIVKYPVEGYSEMNEMISVKTSSTQFSLKSATNDVNGFKIGQLITYLLENIKFYIYRSSEEDLNARNSYRIASIQAFYEGLIKKITSGNINKYTDYYFAELGYLEMLKTFLDKYNKIDKIIANKEKIYRWLCVIFTVSNPSERENVNKQLKTPITDAEISMVKKLMGDVMPDASNIKFLIPDDLKNKKVSFCVFYFDKNKLDNKNITLNCAKTRAINIQELYEGAFELWKQKGYHHKSDQNIYFKYDDILSLFEEPGATSFSTNIKMVISKEGRSNLHYSEEHQEDLIKVIDKLKGDYTPKAGELIKYINNLMDIWYSEKDKQKLITKFDAFLKSIS